MGNVEGQPVLFSKCRVCTRGFDIPQEANEYVVVAMVVMKRCFLDCCQRKKKKGIGKKGWSIV